MAARSLNRRRPTRREPVPRRPPIASNPATAISRPRRRCHRTGRTAAGAGRNQERTRRRMSAASKPRPIIVRLGSPAFARASRYGWAPTSRPSFKARQIFGTLGDSRRTVDSLTQRRLRSPAPPRRSLRFQKPGSRHNATPWCRCLVWRPGQPCRGWHPRAAPASQQAWSRFQAISKVSSSCRSRTGDRPWRRTRYC
jgi:hypothetical protein